MLPFLFSCFFPPFFLSFPEEGEKQDHFLEVRCGRRNALFNERRKAMIKSPLPSTRKTPPLGPRWRHFRSSPKDPWELTFHLEKRGLWLPLATAASTVFLSNQSKSTRQKRFGPRSAQVALTFDLILLPSHGACAR